MSSIIQISIDHFSIHARAFSVIEVCLYKIKLILYVFSIDIHSMLFLINTELFSPGKHRSSFFGSLRLVDTLSSLWLLAFSLL
jgi:hypothetical protein